LTGGVIVRKLIRVKPRFSGRRSSHDEGGV